MCGIKLKIILVLYSYFCVFDHGTATQSLTRTKRETRNCKDKYEVLGTHSACKSRSSQVVTAGVSEADKIDILGEHNKYRGLVNPPAANMLKMTWDTELAEVAQVWAETCLFKHDASKDRNIPGRLSAGQNIGDSYQSWADCIKAWNDEVEHFSYGDDTTEFEKVGHYTQVVWATSYKIGCGMATCGSRQFYVCNYGPAGNIGSITTPYKQGASKCADCPGTCANSLCDCGSRTCNNGGTLDTSTCLCTCKHPTFQIGAECKLDCSNVTLPFICSAYPDGCTLFSSTFPFECPSMCEYCPYAAYDYEEGGIKYKNNSGNKMGPSVAFTVIFLLICELLL